MSSASEAGENAQTNHDAPAACRLKHAARHSRGAVPRWHWKDVQRIPDCHGELRRVRVSVRPASLPAKPSPPDRLKRPRNGRGGAGHHRAGVEDHRDDLDAQQPRLRASDAVGGRRRTGLGEFALLEARKHTGKGTGKWEAGWRGMGVRRGIRRKGLCTPAKVVGPGGSQGGGLRGGRPPRQGSRAARRWASAHSLLDGLLRRKRSAAAA